MRAVIFASLSLLLFVATSALAEEASHNHHHKEPPPPSSSPWHAFTNIWFFISIGVFGFVVFIAMLLVCIKLFHPRRWFSNSSKTMNDFEPLIEAKTPPQIDA